MPKHNEESEFLHYSEYELDKEWQKQPALFHKYALHLANARNDLTEAKAEFELTEAELSRAIRATPERYGLSKITESLIEASVKVQVEYQQALKKMNRAKHEVDIAQAAVDALHHKKAALENAVKLFSMDYYADPKVKDSDTRSRERQEELTSGGRFNRAKDKLNRETK